MMDEYRRKMSSPASRSNYYFKEPETSREQGREGNADIHEECVGPYSHFADRGNETPSVGGRIVIYITSAKNMTRFKKLFHIETTSSCLALLFAVIFVLTLSGCGGGGGGSGREVMITPPGNRAPAAVRAFSDITLTHEPGNPQRWRSEGFDTYFTDPDLDSLGYSSSVSRQGVASAAVAGGTPNYLVVETIRAGTTVVTVRASDPFGLSVSQSFTVTVREDRPRSPNRAPTAVRPFSDITLTHEPGNPERWISEDLSTYFADPDLDRIGYIASESRQGVASASIGFYISNPGSNFLVVDTIRAGTTVVTVEASDPFGRTVSQSFTVTVLEETPRPPNRAPTAVRAFSDITLTHEPGNPERWRLDGLDTYFTDPDLDSLGYSAISSNDSVANASIGYSSNLGSHYMIVHTYSAGTAVITVRVRDPFGLSVSQSFTVTVR